MMEKKKKKIIFVLTFFLCRYLDMDLQLRTLKENTPSTDESGLPRRVLPVLALNEVG